MARICVIGAGAGGMAVAARLGAKGHEVTVLERSDRTGGKLHTKTADGYSFDVGPSLFTLPAVYLDLFLKTGRPLEHEVDLIEVEPGFTYSFPDRNLTLPGSSIGRTTAALHEQLGEEAAESWRQLMRRAGEVWAMTRQDVLGSEVSARQLAAMAKSPKRLKAVAPWLSLHRLARKSLTDPHLVTVMDRYATYSGSQPKKAPGALVTIPFVEQTFGLWHVGGGLGQLAAALQRRVEQVGATIRTRAEVAAIEHDESGITGVQLVDGEKLDADIVVSDLDARHLPSLLGKSDGRQGTNSYSGFALLLALDGESEKLNHHNVWFPEDYDSEFRDLAAGRLVRNPAIYVCRPNDEQMAPPGCEAWFLLVNAPRHGDGTTDTFDYSHPDDVNSYADHLLKLLAQRGCDIRDRIRWRQIQSPLDLSYTDGSGDGAIYGAASHGAMSVLRRPANTSDIPGLFLVGGTAHPGGGLPLVGIGAEIVADKIGRGDERPETEPTQRGCS
ncbi:MAG: phytoene desaturase [Micrococcales bacterium]|nr:phytoene desaturase [Micrococcales bacterium]